MLVVYIWISWKWYLSVGLENPGSHIPNVCTGGQFFPPISGQLIVVASFSFERGSFSLLPTVVVFSSLSKNSLHYRHCRVIFLSLKHVADQQWILKSTFYNIFHIIRTSIERFESLCHIAASCHTIALGYLLKGFLVNLWMLPLLDSGIPYLIW